MDGKIWLQGMTLITKAFNIHPDKQTLQVWLALLEDVGDQDFIEAVTHLCRTKEKVPPNLVAAIRNEIDAKNFSPEEAWQKVLQQISQTGIYGDPKFEDPAIAKAVQAMGWKDICNTPNRDMGTTRAHFYRTYEACRKRANLMETYKVIETNLEIRKMIEGIGRKMLPLKPLT